MIKALIKSNPFLLETAKSLRFWLASIIRRFSFKLLSKLDPTFSSNISLISPQPIEVGAAEIKTPNVSNAVVLNNNDVIATPEVVNFYFSGLFKDSELRAKLTPLILSKVSIGSTITEIENATEHFFTEEIRKDTPPPEYVEGYKVFYEHKKSVENNKRAYTTKDRERPSAIFWPDPTNTSNGRSIYNELPYVQKLKLVSKTTPLGSAGSCFASEIAQSFQKNGYNYVITEKPIAEDGGYRFMSNVNPPPSCAAWGTIFNTPSFKQLVEKAFDVRQLPKILWVEKFPDGTRKYYDPFRENVEFSSVEAFENNYELHKKATREAFLQCKVFVITLGLNEVWYFKSDGSVFSRSPWKMAPSLVEYRTLTVEENVNDLQRMLDILRAHNPDFHLIVTLSPIGLHATFRGDTDHIISANCHSKATLRIAAEEFVKRNKNVSYFPSYEMVNFCTENPFREDQRNVKPETVSNVMKLFHEIYVH